jgi:hypothetical protein
MLTTAGVTAFTMPENPWANCGGTPAAVLELIAGGRRTSAADRDATATAPPITRFNCAFICKTS